MRLIAILLALALLSGCGRLSLPDLPLPDIPPVTTGEDDFTWQPRVLANTPDCGAVLEHCGLEEEGDYTLVMTLYNHTQQSQLFSLKNICLEGWQVMDFWGEEIPGNSVRTVRLPIPGEKLEQVGLSGPESLSFRLQIFSQMDLEQTYLVNHAWQIYPTGQNPARIAAVSIPRGAGDRLLADNSQCTLVLRGATQNADSLVLHFLMENKTRSEMSYRFHSVRLNGAKADLPVTGSVSPGARKAVDAVFPLPPAVGTVRQVELGAYVYDGGHWFGSVWVGEDFFIELSCNSP